MDLYFYLRKKFLKVSSALDTECAVLTVDHFSLANQIPIKPLNQWYVTKLELGIFDQHALCIWIL